jgi:ribosomal protein L7/L12
MQQITVEYHTVLSEVIANITLGKKLAAVVLVRNTLDIPLLQARDLVDQLLTLQHYSIRKEYKND